MERSVSGTAIQDMTLWFEAIGRRTEARKLPRHRAPLPTLRGLI